MVLYFFRQIADFASLVYFNFIDTNNIYDVFGLDDKNKKKYENKR